MATRHERVVLTLDDNFTTEMARAAAATAMLDRNLKSLSGSAKRTQSPMQGAGRDIDKYAAGVERAARGTYRLDHSLGDLSGSAVRTRTPLQGTSRDIDQAGRSADRSGHSINQLTGRLRVLADAAAVLGPSLVPISAIAVPALSGLTAQVGFAAIGLGTLIASVQGVGDALKAVNEAALEPTAANLEKAAKAMEGLGPEAQEFVAQFQLLRPTLKEIRDAGAAGWFPGLTDAMRELEGIGPRVARLFGRIGEAGGSLISEGAAALAGPQWAGFLDFVENNAPRALDELGRTVGNLVKGLAELWMAFDPLNDDFSAWLLRISRSFADWSAGLSQTDGFAAFVDYIRTNGPRVADALGALGNALVQIVEAVAPLGGPSLKIIEVFADSLAAIADSDLGTPIMAGVAALALYNRTLAATTALQARFGMTSAATGAAAAGGVGGVGLFAAGGRARAVGSDLRTYAALRTQVLARTTAETERMNAAMARTKTNLAATAKSVGPAALALGTLAVAAADTEGTMIGANTTMATMAGSMLGPYGAAVGAMVGNLLDFKAGLEAVNDALEANDQRMANSMLQQRLDGFRNPMAWLTGQNARTGFESVWSKVTTGKDSNKELAKQAATWQSLGTVEDAQARMEAMRRAEAAEMGMSRATGELAKQLGMTNAEMRASIDAIDARKNAAAAAFDAETAWRDALRAAAEQAKASNDGVNKNTESAQRNREALARLRDAWNAQRDAMVENGAGAGAIEKKFRGARKAFIDTAVAMGVPIEQARRLARAWLLVPEKRATKVIVNGATEAQAQVANVKAAMDRLRDKKVTITVVRQMQGLAKQADAMDAHYGSNPADGGTIPVGGGRPIRSADGSTVPDDGGGYRDYLPYWLAPMEEVISNRRGQADTFRPELKDINRGMTRKQVAERMLARGLADGGTADQQSWLSYLSSGSGGSRGGVERLEKADHKGSNRISYIEHVGANRYFIELANGAAYAVTREGLKGFKGWHKALADLRETGLKGVTRALERTEKAMDRETKARDNIVSTMDSLRGSVRDRLTSEVFPETNVWAKGGTIADARRRLIADTAEANRFHGLVATLKSKGLTGPALDDLLANADNATIANFAAGSRAELTQYRRDYELRAKSIGRASNSAATAAYGKQLDAANRELRGLRAEVRELRKEQKQEQEKNRKSRKRGSGNASRNRKKG